MPYTILFDQLHLTFFLPDPLDENATDTIRAALADPQFLIEIHQAVYQLLKANSALAILDVVVSW